VLWNCRKRCRKFESDIQVENVNAEEVSEGEDDRQHEDDEGIEGE